MFYILGTTLTISVLLGIAGGIIFYIMAWGKRKQVLLLTFIQLVPFVDFFVRVIMAEDELILTLTPLLHLIMGITASVFSVQTLTLFRTYYNKKDLILSGFFFINWIVWYVIFIQDLISLTSYLGSGTLPTDLLRITGTFVFIFTLGLSYPLFLLTKEIFLQEKREYVWFEKTLILLYGIVIGASLSNTMSNAIILVESNNITFTFPNLTSWHAIVGMTLTFVPGFILYYFIIINKRFLLRSKEYSQSINTLKISQLRLMEYSIFTYIFGGGLSFILFVFPFYYTKLLLPYGLNYIISTPIIFIHLILMRVSISPPDWTSLIVHKYLETKH